MKDFNNSNRSEKELRKLVEHRWLVDYAICFEVYEENNEAIHGFKQSDWDTFTNKEQQLALDILEELRIHFDGVYPNIIFQWAS